MVILKITKPVRLGDEILQPGELVRVAHERQLVARGYARRPNKEEIMTILDAYTECAEKLFNDEAEGIQAQPREQGRQERLF